MTQLFHINCNATGRLPILTWVRSLCLTTNHNKPNMCCSERSWTFCPGPLLLIPTHLMCSLPVASVWFTVGNWCGHTVIVLKASLDPRGAVFLAWLMHNFTPDHLKAVTITLFQYSKMPNYATPVKFNSTMKGNNGKVKKLSFSTNTRLQAKQLNARSNRSTAQKKMTWQRCVQVMQSKAKR